MKTKLTRDVWVEISKENFKHNLALIKSKLAPHTKILLVLKADAYGHGSIEIAKIALKNGVYQIGVATFDEAMELRRRFKKARILILGATPKGIVKKAIKHDIELCVYDITYAKYLNKQAKKQHKQALIHLKLDTGMNRIGYQISQESLQEIQDIQHLSHITIQGVFTHFASADAADKSHFIAQYSAFKDFLNLILKDLKPLLHCANSASFINEPTSHLDMVRIGIIAYGLQPSKHTYIPDLKPVMSLKARIVHIKEIEAGQSVSYGATFVAPKKTTIATLPIGYADGVMRLLSNKAKFLLRGRLVRVVGNICMDQCMIDISNVYDAKIFDVVTLFGRDAYGNNLSVEYLADIIGTIHYEIVCAISGRVKRVYV